MLQFKRYGKIVEEGITFATDFVCDAYKEHQSLIDMGFSWSGTGIGVCGDFETWEISTVSSPN